MLSLERSFRTLITVALTTGVLNAVCAALPNKQLVYCSEASPMGFDPSQLFNGVDYAAAGRTLYDTLIRFDRNTLALKPSLATDWRVSEDGRVYTFNLRHGVKFHNTPWYKPTREFKAEEVEFTFDPMRKPMIFIRNEYKAKASVWIICSFNKTVEKIEAMEN